MNIKPIALAAGIMALAACSDNTPTPQEFNGGNFVSQQPGATITMTLDPAEGRVHGRVVNVYNGTYTIDGNNIKFGEMVTTMMMGPQDAMATEREYLTFMPTVETYNYQDGKLTLTGVDGKEIVFEQVEELPDAQ